MSSDSRRPRVLTVGAYERDNFGDLLFLLVTERYLPDFEIVPAAPFAADMTALMDREVIAYGDYLADQDADVIWCVGGQTGGTTRESAFGMSKSAEELAAYRAAPPKARRALLDAAYGGAPILSPYLPNPGAFERNAGAVHVLNSVGLAGVAGLTGRMRKEVVGTLRAADRVSVRDRQSSELLRELGVQHRLAPDVVHALGALDPAEPDPESDVAVVQVSTNILRQLGEEALARALAASPALTGLRLQLLAAGTAVRHDSVDDLERLADRVRKADPGREVEVDTDRRPTAIVDAVRRSRVVISSSLHMRIVAAAYGVPRVTLQRPKPKAYAEHWDPLMPYDVQVADLDDAVAAALVAGRRADVRRASDLLVALADDNARELAADVRQLVANGGPDRRRVAAERRAAYLDVVRGPSAPVRPAPPEGPRGWRRLRATVRSGLAGASK